MDTRQYPIAGLCMLFGVSKQAYYKFDTQRVVQRMTCEAFALEYVRKIRAKDSGIGGMKLWYMYRQELAGSATLGRDLFEDMIARYGLKIRRRSRHPKTTDSSHGYPTYPNLARKFIPTAPCQLWVSDITYIRLSGMGKRGFCYLSIVLDAYSEEILGYSVGPTLEARYSMDALNMALARLDEKGISGTSLIHHSDRGIQYACTDYTGILKRRGIKISMTENGNPKDNAQAERINNTMKNELLRGMKFNVISEVEQALVNAVKFYNTRRPHMSIDMKTPQQAALCMGTIRKRWKSYRLEAINKEQSACLIAENRLSLPASVVSLRASPSSQPQKGVNT